MKNKTCTFLMGLLCGRMLLSGSYAAASAVLIAAPSTQRFYVNGQPIQFEAYAIHGNNFVKLRDIGKAVDFAVDYDGSTNNVFINSSQPFANVQFELTYSDGRYVDADNGHLSSKGLFQTDRNGEIRVSGVTGTIVAKDVKSIPGYTIDPATQIQPVEVKPNDTQTLVFYNAPAGNFELIKVVEGNESKRIPNVAFEIRRASDDVLVDTITTDSNGRATLQLDAGNYYAIETECPKEFKKDSERHSFTVQNGKHCTLTVKNKAFSGVLIHKTDSVTGKGIYGVTFLLYDSTNKPIGPSSSRSRLYHQRSDRVRVLLSDQRDRHGLPGA